MRNGWDYCHIIGPLLEAYNVKKKEHTVVRKG